ncbi:4-hydroxy-tetrahydrodipicolinate reductase [uncultured Treponema sp.]|uniref:4-hydroxy-tetrahydrodipicolinate reductase n=1 Tax=uncultured Treponema sp. TaxID=162155 RepID=UPI0025FD5275|nr:4-hydroxy-tetrahydrodipicolinate reductase [uncultured Treponema sp.]
MKIALVGYGKMGHMIETCAKAMGHEVVATIDVVSKDASNLVAAGDYAAVAEAVKNSGADGVIEFSHPTAVLGNLNALIPLGLPVVCGTTGWAKSEAEIEKLCASSNGTCMRSSNFSIGVNMFYKIVEEAAKIMSEYSEYDVAVWEAHHNQKADSPSGTALEVARRVMNGNKSKTEMVFDAFHEKPKANELHVSSTRVGSVPGTHTVFFDSPADSIELTHRARSREGFARGSVVALEKLAAKIAAGSLSKGKLYGMSDLF